MQGPPTMLAFLSLGRVFGLRMLAGMSYFASALLRRRRRQISENPCVAGSIPALPT